MASSEYTPAVMKSLTFILGLHRSRGYETGLVSCHTYVIQSVRN
jgi:hypothetical protein